MSIQHISTTTTSNPWKGLNFYHEGEILYGRDEEIQSLALYVINNIQTVLYGKSGIGKSSIIHAGVFPIARKEGLHPVPIRLKHDSDTSYISQIKAAFNESGIGICQRLEPIDEVHETLWEYLHRNTFFDTTSHRPVRPLIVLDQFEEIFTLQHDEKKKLTFFSELADLLNEVTPNYITSNLHSPGGNKVIKYQSHGDNFSFDFGVDEECNSEHEKEYVSDSLFNIVFAIREDFLSYLERYTKYIPVMKSNRYALLPINEEQAKDIIMKPINGLVNIDVAKLIIEKVTGRSDFSLGNTPEIEVDAAVLSLYLSRIYIKKGEGTPQITASLVNEFSKDIIKDFYEESVSDLPPKEIEKLEDLLLTYDNRRNNVSRNDLISEGISKKVVDTLVENRKLLRQFSYQGDFRVEFIHDILCPIVTNRVVQRENEQRIIIQKRKVRSIIIVCTILLSIFLGFSIYEYKKRTVDSVLQGYLIIQEDSMVSLTEYWKAEIIMTIDKDTFLHHIVDKSTPSCTFQYNPLNNKTPHLSVKFLIGDYNVKIPAVHLYNRKNVNIEIPMYRKDRLIPVSGKVYSNTGAGSPIFNALVIIGENIATTNEQGLFTIYVDSLIYKYDNKIRIIKNNYEFYESDIKPSKSSYKLRLKGESIFPKEAKEIEMLIDSTKNSIRMSGRVYTIQTPHDTRFGNCIVNANIKGEQINGYFYYLKTYNNVKTKYNSYFLFTGKLDTSSNQFNCTVHDASFNYLEMKGIICEDGEWKGVFYVLDNIKGSFSFRPNK